MSLIKWNFQIPEEMLEWIREYCKKTSLSQSDVARLALQDFKEKNEKQK
jgi:Arc/MetJ-type ribon-helix-helix transcriptional regulator